MSPARSYRWRPTPTLRRDPPYRPFVRLAEFLSVKVRYADKAGVGAVWFNVGFRAKLVML